MKAKFIGKNGSIGFVSGKIYDIKTKCGFVFGKETVLIVSDKNSRKNCPYSCLETMLQNWELL